MKLTFLGTSHGVPERNRKCTSVMLTVGGAHYIIDAGVPLMSTLTAMGADLNAVKAIFLTHMHGDHSNGLIEFVDLCTWFYKDLRTKIYVPEIAARDAMMGWINMTHGEDVSAQSPEFIEVQEGAFYNDGNVRITAIDNDHLQGRPSYSYVVEAEGKRVVFTGDMGHNKYSDFPPAAYEQECDLVVTEAAHCRLTDCMDIFGKLTTKKLIVSHIVPANEPEAALLNEKVNYPVEVAFDGMEIEI